MHESKCPDGYENRWTLNQWGSHPDLENDDCFTGDDFDSLEALKRSEMFTDAPYYVEYLEIDGPVGSDHYELIRNPHYSKRQCRQDDADDRRERAMQAGMGLGIQAYNEEMGYD